ncbi:hypothetical protein, partial [Arsenophonus sp.]|uniref:hypothetical protein n=1 Tax=Arsenophonus sp. TaxID=1872640 RepID=UPI00387A6DBF
VRRWVKKQRNCCQKDCITWKKNDGYAAKPGINVSKIRVLGGKTHYLIKFCLTTNPINPINRFSLLLAIIDGFCCSL